MRLTLPLSSEQIKEMKAGQFVLLTGRIYTARDAAHRCMYEEAQKGGVLPIKIEEEAIYYAGPAPRKEGWVIGSCGPTTSGRMDKYVPWLMEKGQRVMIGKGLRSEVVVECIKKHGGIYFTTVGGAGAFLATCVTKMACIAYEHLGPEAIYCLEVKDFPVIVTIDAEGNNLYEIEKSKYQKI